MPASGGTFPIRGFNLRLFLPFCLLLLFGAIDRSEAMEPFCTVLAPPTRSGTLLQHFPPVPDGEGPLSGIGSPGKLWLGKNYPPGYTLKIHFMEGDAPLLPVQKHVIDTASEWLNYANLHFQVTQQSDADIRITFLARPGTYSSFVGTDSLYSQGPSMGLGDIQSVQDPVQFQAIVLHEFSRAGLAARTPDLESYLSMEYGGGSKGLPG